MSCIAVKVTEKEIQFAADSIVLRGSLKTNTPETSPKLEKINNMIIGASGYKSESGLMFQYAQNHRPADTSLNSIRQFFMEFGEWKQKFGEKFTLDNEYFLAYDGKCFYNICNDVEEIKDYCAIGAGMDYAYAALYLGKTAKQAVKVACALCSLVSEPIIEYKMTRK